VSIVWAGGCGSAAGGGGGVAAAMRSSIFLLERFLSILTSLPGRGGGGSPKEAYDRHRLCSD